jgi:hypothetical protein
MFEMDAVTEHHIQNRTGPAVVMKRRVGGVKFDRAVGIAILEDYMERCHRVQQLKDMRLRPAGKEWMGKAPVCIFCHKDSREDTREHT